jgi:hypothetical protein
MPLTGETLSLAYLLSSKYKMYRYSQTPNSVEESLLLLTESFAVLKTPVE